MHIVGESGSQAFGAESSSGCPMNRHCFSMLLLLLALLIAGGCDSSTEPEGDEFDWTGLLTDEEMLTDEDPNAPEENPAWADWIRSNNIAIRSLEAENFSDLKLLAPYLDDRRIVQLGESGHGVAEFNKTKVRFIKFLHEVMGFNVIAFESALFECFYTNQNASSLTPHDMMVNSIFGVWHTWEVVSLFEYVKEVCETDRPLTLAGFDIQMSSSKGASHRPEFLRQLLDTVDTDFASHVYDVDSRFISNYTDVDFIRENKAALIAEYESIVNFIDEHKQELVANSPGDPSVPAIARQIAWSVTKNIEHLFAYYTGLVGQAYEIRDKNMAENVEFLINELYPEDKIIIWAHNLHVCHDRRSMPAGVANSMGKWIVDSHRPELYTVGLYMCRGKAAWNNREIYEITPVMKGSIESVLYRTRRKYCFVDMLGRERNDGNSWMFELVSGKDWGRTDWPLVPRNQYDAILFIDTVSPPRYFEGLHLNGDSLRPLQTPISHCPN